MKRLRRIALVLGTLVVMAMLLEIGTRLFTDVLPPIVRIDPVAGLHYVPSFQGDLYSPESKRLVHVRFNRDGFRGPDRDHAKPAGIRRIAVLGDSMVAALEVDEDKTFVARLERLLGPGWEVLNFGVTGTSTAKSLHTYREYVSRYDVDLVVCGFFAVNDVVENSRRMSRQARLYFDLDAAGELVQLPVRTSRSAFKRWLRRHSRFYAWQKFARARIGQRGRAPVALSPAYRTRPEGDLAHAWLMTEALVRTLAAEAKERFVLVNLPSAGQVDADVFARLGGDHAGVDPSYPARRMGAFCRTHGIAWLALGEGFGAEHYFNGIGHYNEAGHELVARALRQYVGAR